MVFALSGIPASYDIDNGLPRSFPSMYGAPWSVRDRPIFGG